MNELLFITVPSGVERENRCLIRVLLVPMLDGDTLEACGMAMWPPTNLMEADSQLAVEWRVDENQTAFEVVIPRIQVNFDVQPGLWESTFPGSTPVGASPTHEEFAEPQVKSTSAIADAVHETYTRPAAAEFAPDSSETPVGYNKMVLDGLQRWRNEMQEPDQPLGRREEKTELPGFHRMISYLREHPTVLRHLGLIFDIALQLQSGLGELSNQGQVRVLWPGASGSSFPRAVSPWTRFGRSFRPLCLDGSISAGMVTLSQDPSVVGATTRDQWKVVTFDVEGAARRLTEASKILDSVDEDDGAIDPRIAVSLPAMRSLGLQLIHVGREQNLRERRNAGIANARRRLDDLILSAEDLVLGYRIDIKRGGGPWLSLHQRLASYQLNGSLVGGAELLEEGHLKPNALSLGSDGVPRGDETVARWTGWSLSVTPPRLDGDRLFAQENEDLPIRLGFKFSVPKGSLPLLRYAAQYSIRARVADMAGGGLAWTDPDADRCTISQISYGRYEPVPAPILTLPEQVSETILGPRESTDVIVVRSDPDQSINAFDAANPGYRTVARRVLERPSGSLAMAEQHRMLDIEDRQRVFEWVLRSLSTSSNASGDSNKPPLPLPDPAAGGIQAFPRPQPGSNASIIPPEDWAKPWPEPETKLLELRERKASEPPMRWEQGTLVVRLPPGEQREIEMSSTLTEDFFDHFALRNDLSKAATEAGRNPLITPARVIRFVHAVRRPLWNPDASLRLEPVERTIGQTSAFLTPRSLTFHAGSTSQFEVSAEWDEVPDDDTTPPRIKSLLQAIRVDPGDSELRETIRHEFGDTRHRMVTYSLTAISRFQTYFHTEEAEAGPDAFVVRRQLEPAVSILNSARPAAPVVLSVRPAFLWKDTQESAGGITTLRRQRVASYLRVELARPWYQTGAGECLSVILWDRRGVQPLPEIRSHLTQVGRDPIWQTPEPERWPTELMFSGAIGAARPVRLIDSGSTALVLPFQPWFHDNGWYADVGLPGVAATSYCPFAKLAVARYQPESIEGCDLSPVITTGMFQLLPDRTMIVTRSGNTVQVSLEGLGPAGPTPNRVDAILEECDIPNGTTAGNSEVTALSPLPDGLSGWLPVAGQAGQTRLSFDPVTLELPTGNRNFRVRVRETENIGGEVATPRLSTTAELSERVVFTSTVLLANL